MTETKSAPAAGGNGKAQLTEKANTANQVTFRYNPERIYVSHQNKVTVFAGPPEEGKVRTKEAVSSPGMTTFQLSNLIFFGSDVVSDCKQLLAWTDMIAQPGENAELPKLVFTWGSGFNFDVTISNVSIDYQRFTSEGKPIRASVGLACTVCEPETEPTNPSSGGIPGRRGHTLVAGENLQHVAMANYGRPGAWRALAAANGIEDPLAVLPGTVIYLPAPTELTELAELADGNSR
jgi:hypothetical protein